MLATFSAQPLRRARDAEPAEDIKAADGNTIAEFSAVSRRHTSLSHAFPQRCLQHSETYI